MPVITPAFAQTMAAYNAALNTKTYAAAARLSDAERRADRGAFWHSIQGTLNHLAWADRMWMSRIDGWEAPTQALAESGTLHGDFAALAEARVRIDAELSGWAARIEPGWLDGALTWFSGAAGREITAPRTLIVMHLFNHQTHHRGQVHGMLTAAGERVGDTDLPIVLSSEA